MEDIINSHTRLPRHIMNNFTYNTDYKNKRNLSIYYIKHYQPLLYDYQIRFVGALSGYYRRWEELALTRCYESDLAEICNKIIKGSLWRLTPYHISTLVHYVVFSVARALPHGVYRFLIYAELIIEPPIDPCITYNARVVLNKSDLDFIGSECCWCFTKTNFSDKALFIPISPKYGIFMTPSNNKEIHTSGRPISISKPEVVDDINHRIMEYNYAYGGNMVISRNKNLLYSYMDYMIQVGREGKLMYYDKPTVVGIVPAPSLVLRDVTLTDDNNPRIDYALAILSGNFPASKMYFNPEGTTWTPMEHDMSLEIAE